MRTKLPAAVAALAMLAVAAHPTEAPGYHLDADDPESIYFVESEAFFTATTTGVGNVDNETDEWLGWSPDAPTDPVGGVTVAAGTSGLRAITEDAEFERGQFTADGTVTGYVDSFVLDLHLVDNPAVPFCGVVLAVDLDIDGVPILDMDGHGGPVDVAVVDGVATLKVTDITAKLLSFGDFAQEFIGDEDTVHQVHLSVTQYPICTEVVWRYDTADAPSSIRFNHDPSLADVSGYTTFSALNPPVSAD